MRNSRATRTTLRTATERPRSPRPESSMAMRTTEAVMMTKSKTFHLLLKNFLGP